MLVSIFQMLQTCILQAEVKLSQEDRLSAADAHNRHKDINQNAKGHSVGSTCEKKKKQENSHM